MEQPNRILIHGLAFLSLSDGTFFPVLAGGDDGPDVPTPDPVLTRQQQELNNLQLENARRSRAMEPILMEKAGLRYDPKTGGYVDLDPTLAGNKREIERMQTERSLKALKGELPISKTLQREFQVGQQQLDEQINRQGGPGAKNSTAGVLKQEAFDRNRIALQEAEQRDMLTTAEALALNRQNSRSVEASQAENPFAAQARMIQPAQQSIASSREQDNFTRGLQYQSNQAGQQNMAGYISGGMQLVGTLGAAKIMSDPEAKYDVEPVSDAELLASVREVPVYRWKYRGDPYKKVHIGGMATDFPGDVSDGKTLDVVSLFGLLTGSVRELDRKVRQLTSEEEPLTPGMLLSGA